MNTSIERRRGTPGHQLGRRIAIAVSYMLMLIGGMALVYAGYVVNDAYRYQKSAARMFETMRPANSETDAVPSSTVSGLSADTVSTEDMAPDASVVSVTKNAPPPIAIGNVIGRMDVPRIGLSVMIAEGDSNAVLRHAVGHLSSTPLPGDAGNVVLAGHRDTFFRPLRNIRSADLITIDTLDGLYQYRVEWIRVMPPDNVSVLAPSQSSEITLITCFPFNYIGPAPDRFVVRAIEIGPENGTEP